MLFAFALLLVGCSHARRQSTNVIMAPERVMIVEGSYTYHRKSCELINGEATDVRLDVMREKISKAKPYKPCEICKP